jgi:hypothetical protein
MNNEAARKGGFLISDGDYFCDLNVLKQMY